MSEETGLTRRDLEAAIVKKAWEDPSFRERLLRNPKEVLQAEIVALQEGVRLPDNLEVQVLEETGNVFYLVLPHTPAGIEVGELSDEELEAAAGGRAVATVSSVQW